MGGTVYSYASQGLVVDCLAEATMKAMTSVPAMGAVKLRFNFGEFQMFCGLMSMITCCERMHGCPKVWHPHAGICLH